MMTSAYNKYRGLFVNMKIIHEKNDFNLKKFNSLFEIKRLTGAKITCILYS